MINPRRTCGLCKHYRPSEKPFIGKCAIDDDNCNEGLTCKDYSDGATPEIQKAFEKKFMGLAPVRTSRDIQKRINAVEDGAHLYSGMMHKNRVKQLLSECMEIAQEIESRQSPETQELIRIGKSTIKAFETCDELGVQQIRKTPTIEKLLEWAEQEDSE